MPRLPSDASPPRAPLSLAIRALVVLQALACGLFLASLVVAVVYEDQIRESFRTTIIDDLAQSLAGNVGFAEQAVATPLAARHLAPHQLDGIREEIALYRRDPRAYVAYLAGGGGSTLDQTAVLEASGANPLKRAFVEQLIGWRAGVKSRFDSSFAKIGRDIAIFLATNAAAAGLAIVLATWARRRHPLALRTSVILTAAIALSSLFYVDRDWLYDFVANDWAVFGYPLMLLVTVVYLGSLAPQPAAAK